MSKPLLTIIIPTYKRSANLDILLRALREETCALTEEVIVQVSDNCSPDDTPQVVARLTEGWPALRSHRHSRNIGADRNFCHCVESVQTRWFWIIGDDDLPKRGVIAQVVALLRSKQPALLYMQSEWTSPVLSTDQGEPSGTFRVAILDNTRFAASVHVWMTFISGMVIDSDRLRTALGPYTIDRFDSSNLVQLGWVLPLLNSTGPFAFVDNRCILATKDNSGGYGLLTVFGANFARIVSESFGKDSTLTHTIIRGNLMHYLPGLIWGARANAAGGTHAQENPWPAMSRQIGSRWLYWVLLVPLGRFPRWLAQPFFQTWRVCNRLHREWQKHMPKLRRSA